MAASGRRKRRQGGGGGGEGGGKKGEVEEWSGEASAGGRQLAPNRTELNLIDGHWSRPDGGTGRC